MDTQPTKISGHGIVRLVQHKGDLSDLQPAYGGDIVIAGRRIEVTEDAHADKPGRIVRNFPSAICVVRWD